MKYSPGGRKITTSIFFAVVGVEIGEPFPLRPNKLFNGRAARIPTHVSIGRRKKAVYGYTCTYEPTSIPEGQLLMSPAMKTTVVG